MKLVLGGLIMCVFCGGNNGWARALAALTDWRLTQDRWRLRCSEFNGVGMCSRCLCEVCWLKSVVCCVIMCVFCGGNNGRARALAALTDWRLTQDRWRLRCSEFNGVGMCSRCLCEVCWLKSVVCCVIMCVFCGGNNGRARALAALTDWRLTQDRWRLRGALSLMVLGCAVGVSVKCVDWRALCVV